MAGLGLSILALAGGASQAGAGEHDHHVLANEAVQASVQRFERSVTVPVVTLTRGDGARLPLSSVLDDGRPVVLNFIFTTCTAICPVTSQVFAEFRGLLAPNERDALNMVSISIDPEQDSPRKLTSYAKRFGNNGTWAHFTGTARDSEVVQRAFEAWRGDKMNHVPQTFIRPALGKPWVRLDGFISPEGLLSEYRKLTSK
jgi:protein SCO1/2